MKPNPLTWVTQGDLPPGRLVHCLGYDVGSPLIFPGQSQGHALSLTLLSMADPRPSSEFPKALWDGAGPFQEGLTRWLSTAKGIGGHTAVGYVLHVLPHLPPFPAVGPHPCHKVILPLLLCKAWKHASTSRKPRLNHLLSSGFLSWNPGFLCMLDPGIGLLIPQKRSALIPRAWPLPDPQQDNHSRMPQPSTPRARKLFSCKWLLWSWECQRYTPKGGQCSGCPGATCSSSRKRRTMLRKKQNDI